MLSVARIIIWGMLGLGWIAQIALGAEPRLNWRWSNPQPHGNHITDMALSEGRLVQVGERGQAYFVDRTGLLQSRSTQVTNFLRAVTFLGDRVIVTGENGLVLFADWPGNFQSVSLGTDNWLEGVTAASGLVVAVGDNGAIYTSPDGSTWTRRPQSFSTWLRSVTWGNGTFVAVGESGFIVSSTNGIQWQPRTSGTLQDLNRVAWSASQFWVVGNAGTTLVSSNGVNWAPKPPGATNDLLAVTGENLSLVAGDNFLRVVANNVWSNQLTNSSSGTAPPQWPYFSAASEAGLYQVGGDSGMWLEGIATNGLPISWQLMNDSIRNWLWDVARPSDFYLAAGDHATIMTSDDGIDWNLELVPDSVTNTVFLGVGGSSNLFLAVGEKGAIVTSSNAVVWTALEPRPTDQDLQGVGFTNNTYVVCGSLGTILTSPDAIRWTKRTTSTRATLSSVVPFSGGWIATGDDGIILSSTAAGLLWTSRPSGTTNWLYRVRYLGNQLIAVGQNGTVLTSTDGLAWVRRTSGVTAWLNDIVQVQDRYYALGTQGTVITSTNLVQWQSQGIITEKSLYAATTTSSQLVVVGIEGLILRAPLVPVLDPVRFIDFSHQPGGNAFLLTGKPDQRFTLDRSTDLVSWVTGPTYEFNDSTGTLLIIQEPSSSVTEFYRATLLP